MQRRTKPKDCLADLRYTNKDIDIIYFYFTFYCFSWTLYVFKNSGDQKSKSLSI